MNISQRQSAVAFLLILSLGCQPDRKEIRLAKASRSMLNEINKQQCHDDIMRWASNVLSGSSNQYLPIEATAPYVFHDKSSKLSGWTHMKVLDTLGAGGRAIFIEYAGGFTSFGLFINPASEFQWVTDEERMQIVTNGVWLYWH